MRSISTGYNLDKPCKQFPKRMKAGIIYCMIPFILYEMPKVGKSIISGCLGFGKGRKREVTLMGKRFPFKVMKMF